MTWVNLADNDGAMTIINLLVRWGETLIGIALILGILTRFASLMGTVMMLLFFVAAWDFAFGIVNQRLTCAVVVAGLGVVGVGSYFGLDALLAGSVGSGIRRWLLSGGPDTSWRTG